MVRGSANVFDQIGSSKCGKLHKAYTIRSYIRLIKFVGVWGGGVENMGKPMDQPIQKIGVCFVSPAESKMMHCN